MVARKPGVPRVAASWIPVASARRSGHGMGTPSSWCTAVLSAMTPASTPRLRSAQPRLTTPPQSWPSVTTGAVAPDPVSPSSSVSACRSSSRIGSVRVTPVRSEKPMSSWSTATTRQAGRDGSRSARASDSAAMRRQRYDQVGLP
ncbi:hypothetical protein CMMCAS08_10715 [Clavibacter michiganensis subsp. michiganensis]|nr:hypothetical protein CMMCAS04_00215 [Clavibacter michiganensis subsp. michiganensis]OUE07236.1 hypothetical protein CMMCAS08_10715 [Clavibacter michiganensis subsp. michiganensis]